MKNLKLIPLWYLDGNYNKPIKTKGFKHLVKHDRGYKEVTGYVFIEPVSGAYMTSRNGIYIFESEEEANSCLDKQIKDHVDFLKDQIKHYSEDLLKYNNLIL